MKAIPGVIVECGTWRGGMIAALAETLQHGPRREFVLFDSFKGSLPRGRSTGLQHARWQADPESPDHHDNCRAAPEEARESMRMAGVDARLIEGWFEDTVPKYSEKNILRSRCCGWMPTGTTRPPSPSSSLPAGRARRNRDSR